MVATLSGGSRCPCLLGFLDHSLIAIIQICPPVSVEFCKLGVLAFQMGQVRCRCTFFRVACKYR